MLTIILSILFSGDLSFSNLTVQTLLEWFNLHPFITLIALFDLWIGASVIANELTSIILNLSYADYNDNHYQLCDCDKDCECDYEESNCKECFCKH